MAHGDLSVCLGRGRERGTGSGELTLGMDLCVGAWGTLTCFLEDL
jgi:hypothetical protein